ncbi:MAG: phosphonate ABC transporter ATP-binding protein [Rhodospirillaceae bacterium]|nr:phosphonate ABC transporter ATP-binding protein [Rhodospirillaceae bacterium]
MAVITVRNLHKTFDRKRKALDGVDLHVEGGEMVALIGASGSGKSTLLRHMAGLVAADRRADGCCRVEVLGALVQQQGQLARGLSDVRANVGFIFQQFNLVGRLSVLNNVLIGLLGRIPSWRGNLGMFTREEKLRAMAALDRVGMADFALQRASTLSGGQQQRAAIARVLLQGAQVIFADEPIASLDPASAVRVMEALAHINREDGITTIVSLHQVDYASRFCPRTVAMREGRKVYDGTSTALTRTFLTDLYGADSDELVVGRPQQPQWQVHEAAPGERAAMAGA